MNCHELRSIHEIIIEYISDKVGTFSFSKTSSAFYIMCVASRRMIFMIAFVVAHLFLYVRRIENVVLSGVHTHTYIGTCTYLNSHGTTLVQGIIQDRP